MAPDFGTHGMLGTTTSPRSPRISQRSRHAVHSSNESVSSSCVRRSGLFLKVVITCIRCLLDLLKPRISLKHPLLTDIARVNTLGSLGSAPISDRLGVALRLWGMPIGEFFDLEALSQFCAGSKRYSFSSPLGR
jgi:hypothetical protein